MGMDNQQEVMKSLSPAALGRSISDCGSGINVVYSRSLLVKTT